MDWYQVIDLCIKGVALTGGAVWGVYKIKEYREFKHLIQLDISTHLYKLHDAIGIPSVTWNREGEQEVLPARNHTHAVEVLLKFTNKGRTRLKLYNLQTYINTMPTDRVKVAGTDGHLSLSKRLFTSGNIVPVFKVDNKPEEKTSFYYIEPGVEQTIHYLALITEPRQLLQVVAKFNLVQERTFPKGGRKPGELYPHTVARTYKIDADENLVS